MEPLKLKKPITIDGKPVQELSPDLENLTAGNIQTAIRELGMRQIAVTVQETDMNFHAALFAEACEGLNMDDMDQMNAKDYLNAGRMVRDFFYLDLED